MVTLSKLPGVDGVLFGGYPLGSLGPSGGSASAAGDVWVQGGDHRATPRAVLGWFSPARWGLGSTLAAAGSPS